MWPVPGRLDFGTAWAKLPDALLPDRLLPFARALREPRGPLPAVDWARSLFGCCPLCGLGEAGSEHLLGWCPAVALAWLESRPDSAPNTLLEALHSGAWADSVARFLHQVVFLHLTRLDQVPRDADQSARALRRALLARLTCT